MSTKTTKRQQAFIHEKIRILRHEGYPQRQAIAIAHRQAGAPARRDRATSRGVAPGTVLRNIHGEEVVVGKTHLDPGQDPRVELVNRDRRTRSFLTPAELGWMLSEGQYWRVPARDPAKRAPAGRVPKSIYSRHGSSFARYKKPGAAELRKLEVAEVIQKRYGGEALREWEVVFRDDAVVHVHESKTPGRYYAGKAHVPGRYYDDEVKIDPDRAKAYQYVALTQIVPHESAFHLMPRAGRYATPGEDLFADVHDSHPALRDRARGRSSRDPSSARTPAGLARHIAREYQRRDLTPLELRRDYGLTREQSYAIWTAAAHVRDERRLEGLVLEVLEDRAGRDRSRRRGARGRR